MGMGSIKVCPPRVSDVREGDCFRSKILSRYQWTSLTTKTLLSNLYLEGLFSGDFEPVFRVLLGETAPLSASSILRLKQRWQGEYETWKGRSLKAQYAYCWADGVYLKAGCEKEKTALLVVLGVNEEGKAECRRRAEAYVERLKKEGQEKAAECVMRDWDQFVIFYQFPKAHWKHLRTTNSIESVFAGTRLRANVTKRMRNQKAGLYLVWKLIQRLSENWQEIEGKEWIQAVLSGKKFKDGVIEEEKMEEREVKKAA